MSEYASHIKENFPEAPVPSWAMPNFIFKIASFFDKRIDEATVKEQTLEGVELDGTKIVRDLGFKYFLLFLICLFLIFLFFFVFKIRL